MSVDEKQVDEALHRIFIANQSADELTPPHKPEYTIPPTQLLAIATVLAAAVEDYRERLNAVAAIDQHFEVIEEAGFVAEGDSSGGASHG